MPAPSFSALRRLWLIFWLAAALPVRAEDPYAAATEPDRGDTSDVYRTAHYPILEAPQRLWNLLIHPLGQFTIYAEHEELHLQVRDFFTNADHTFGIYPQVQLGGETGTGGGARLFHTDLFGREKELEALYILSHPDRQLAQFQYRDPAVAGGPLYWTLSSQYLRTDHDDATVSGVMVDEELQEAAEGDDDVARFAQEDLDLTALLGWRSHAGPVEDYRRGWYLEVSAGLSRRHLTDRFPLDRRDYLLDPDKATAAALAIPGLDEPLTFGHLGARIAYDDRDHLEPTARITHGLNYLFPGRILIEEGGLYHSYRNLSYPERGGLLQGEIGLAAGPDEVRYLRLGAELQRFWTLFWRERILAVRARLDQVQPLDGGRVPYAEMPALGGGQRLRGYERGSFRGEGALLLAAEYRYPIWDTWSAFLFYEEGQVFDAYGDLAMKGFHSCYGAGLSLRTAEAFLLGLRVGRSAQEKALLGFSLEQEF